MVLYYKSASHGLCLPCKVLRRRLADNSLEINLKPGKWLSTQEQSERLCRLNETDVGLSPVNSPFNLAAVPLDKPSLKFIPPGFLYQPEHSRKPFKHYRTDRRFESVRECWNFHNEINGVVVQFTEGPPTPTPTPRRNSPPTDADSVGRTTLNSDFLNKRNSSPESPKATDSSSRTGKLMDLPFSMNFNFPQIPQMQMPGMPNLLKKRSRVAQDDKFVDKEFPPSHRVLGSLEREYGDVKWKRLSNMVENPVLFGDISSDDLRQGMVGNCWLVAALATLASNPEYIKSLFEVKEFNPNGEYRIRLYDLGQHEWVTLTLDDYVPIQVENEVPLFASLVGTSIWAQLIEKAFAKFLGDWSKLAGGNDEFALIVLTGFSQVYVFKRQVEEEEKPSPVAPLIPRFFRRAPQAQRLYGGFSLPSPRLDPPNTKSNSKPAAPIKWSRGFAQWGTRNRPRVGVQIDNRLDLMSESAIFKKLLKYAKQNYLIDCCLVNYEPSFQEIQRPDGIFFGHAYSLLGCAEVPVEGSDQVVRLVHLRNPHGGRSKDVMTDWTGKWCNKSGLWKKYPEVAKAVNFQPSDDGNFWMSAQDFLRIYDKIIVLPMNMAPKGKFQKGLSMMVDQVGVLGNFFKGLPAVLNTNTSETPKAEAETRGVALDKIKTSLFHQMSVAPIDPYLKAPDLFNNDLRAKWAWMFEKTKEREIMRA